MSATVEVVEVDGDKLMQSVFVVQAAGFTRFRRVAGTPFNFVFEARQ